VCATFLRMTTSYECHEEENGLYLSISHFFLASLSILPLVSSHISEDMGIFDPIRTAMSSSIEEKDISGHHEQLNGLTVVEAVHTDGTVDYVDAHAIGGDISAMPEGYYRSPQFIGTVVVCFLISSCDM
jgi:hypothetical protein